MAKYELIPAQLRHHGIATDANFFEPQPLPNEWILATHDAQYWHRLHALQLSRAEERRIGFPQSAGLVHREVVIAQGTVSAADYALQHGAAMNVAGGTHHAYADRGEGFCLLNDQAITANYLLRQNKARRILIVDLDVHQGNGTARIFEREPRVFTFSMHGADNYPMQKEHSDLDVPLPSGTADDAYLETLHHWLPRLLHQHQPDFCFYLSGVDVLATDKLGKLKLTPQGCAARDQYVFETLHRAGLPVVTCMGGGYSPRLADIVNAHCETFRIAQAVYFG
jgi:acetoin utilization deacetylase AcuC-like enzyme